MKAYLAFTKKEFLENIRSYKVLMMIVIFIGFGIMSPLTAKLTPQLFEMFVPGGDTIQLPQPTAIDSWMQFYKNVSQLGLIILVVLFSSILTSEINRGSLVIMLTNGLSRKSVILAKFTAVASIWTASYVCALMTTYMYTAYYWNMDEVTHLLFSTFCLWLFGLLLISILLLGNVVVSNSFGPLLFTIAVFLLLLLLNMFEKLKVFNPLQLMTGNVPLLMSDLAVSDFTVAIGVTIAGIAVSLLVAIALFNKKPL